MKQSQANQAGYMSTRNEIIQDLKDGKVREAQQLVPIAEDYKQKTMDFVTKARNALRNQGDLQGRAAFDSANVFFYYCIVFIKL